jgi:Nucleotidyl transferase AbiEii toxin, Type IV TA system
VTSADPERTSEARAAAELALVRVVSHYGGIPEFVLLGGLVPQLLCSASPFRHAGTTDVDVQVDLEIAKGATNAGRLEQALTAAGFTPDDERVWRWQLRTATGRKAEIKFELLADLDTEPQGAIVRFDGSARLGAANLRGTGYAAQDAHERTLHAVDDRVARTAVINVTGVAGFLMAKVAAAAGRRKPRDWYDIAFVLLHNDAQIDGADAVRARFPTAGADARSWLLDLQANFADLASQGTRAYADQFLVDHPDEDPAQVAADGMLAVTAFCDSLLRVA